jgi:peptidoglycan/xylan/chitin deacetylase (PgdA/CDA1 family)
VTSAPEVGHGPRTRPEVALTFHGAGELATARAVLAELHRAGARVTVLAVGTWLASEPSAARMVLDGGHELGNHTEHHLAMRRLDGAAAYAEIEGCAQRLRRLTGGQGRWFRASGTQHTTPTIRRAAARAGYATCLSYDVDSLDWTDPAPGTVVAAVLGGARPGSVVSMHLGHQVTVRALPAVLEGLRRRGLRPVPVGELLA